MNFGEVARREIERVSAERDQAVRDLDAGFAESDHLSAKYYQRMRDAEREMHARELHHFEEEQARAKAEAERDAYRAELVMARSMLAGEFYAVPIRVGDVVASRPVNQEGAADV